MSKPLNLRKDRDFGQVINDTFTFISQNFKPLVKNYLLFVGFLFWREC